MPNTKKQGSSNYAVEQIFGYNADTFTLDFFKKRLKNYCNETYLKQMPSEVVSQYASGVQRGKIHFHEQGYPYVENLLLLDALLNQNNKLVMKIMTKELPQKKALQHLHDTFKTTRSNLKQRLDLDLKVIESSKHWNQLPDNFNLKSDRLSEYRANRIPQNTSITGSQAARFAAWERMREIDQGETTPENIAEKAFYLIRMGQRDLGLSQIEDALEESPQHSLLHFVKGIAFLDEAQYEQRQSDLHTILIDESEPLSGAEHHHQEQAFDRAENAFQSRLTATKALLDAHEYWPDHLPYNWFTNVSPWELQQQVVETILANGLYLISTDRKSPAKLVDFLSTIVNGKGLPRPLICPEMFPLFGRCLALAHALGKPELRNQLIDKWLVEVKAKERTSMGELTLSATYFIRENQPWKNPWPQIIATNVTRGIFADPIKEQKGSKFFTAFAERHIRINSENQLQSLFSQLNLQAWLELVQQKADTHGLAESLTSELKRRIKVCERALNGLPWESTDYAQKWLSRWAYIYARCLFDLGVCHLIKDRSAQAKKTMNKLEALPKTYPQILKKKLTHFTVSYTDDDGHIEDFEEPRDMLGQPSNIFTDKRALHLNPNEGMGLFDPMCFDDGWKTSWLPSELEAPESYAEFIERVSKLKGAAVERIGKLITPS